MSKNGKIIIPMNTEKKLLKKEEIISIGLLIGDWKNEFPEHMCKVMIAEALNYCVYNSGMKIGGYLITRHRVCLVLKIAPTLLNEMLQQFYDELRKEIIQHKHRIKNQARAIADRLETKVEMQMSLFIKYPLLNYMLIELITGQQVELPYYSPYLARLKDRINASDFCSAIDYTGAKGPVVVTLLENKT